MRLEDVTARIRPRGSWEAVDLGFALVRRQFGQILVAWCLTVWPLWAVLLLASRFVPMGLILTIIWWLKPFYGRVPLFILSRSLFGARPTLRETLRAWPRLLFSRFFRLVFTRVPWLVVMPNFAWNRALLLPVIDLEGQRGRGFTQRQSILLQQAGGASSGLTLLCAGYQIALVFAVLGLGTYVGWKASGSGGVLPALRDAMIWDADLPPVLAWSLIVSYLLTVTLVEIFYIGAGFGLYLNCRTSLEGWDVELSFRRLAQRVAKAAAVLAVLALGFCAVPAAQAQGKKSRPKAPSIKEFLEPATAPADKPGADKYAGDRKKIQEVLAGKDFVVHTETHNERIPETSGSGSSRSTSSWDFSALGKFLAAFGWFIFWVVIAAIVAVIAWVIYKSRHFFSGRPMDEEAPVPRTIMGMEITPESLPSDILSAARAAWQAGDARGALSLLYRGSLLWLVQTARLPIRESDTEGDCLRHSLTVPQPAEREYFGDLTAQWIHTAYATHLPAGEVMERLLSTWPYTAKPRGRSPG